MKSLKIYSKPRHAGDQTSGGRGKLLRSTSDLTRVQVLVRETLQNSWDAALEDSQPAYGVHIHRPSHNMTLLLADNVFTDLPSSMNVLRESLQDPELRVLEIFDRGTSGLDGPYRASEAAPKGMPNNFNSFVFDIGTTKTEEGAGGTFGFGKTATFEVSHAHSVVYWSACLDAEGNVEHRLIASALHDPYDENKKRFTGAHWWGDPDADEIVPLRGESARRLGESLFRKGFDDGETGTSILVIDPEVRISKGIGEDAAAVRVPVRSEEHENLIIEQITSALAYSAWPKMIETGPGQPPMRFHIYNQDDEVEITDIVRRRYSDYAFSLTEIRRALGQLNGSVHSEVIPLSKTDLIPIRLRPAGAFPGEPHSTFFGTRKDKIVGYLHLTMTLDTDEHADDEFDRGIRAPNNQLCLMRSQAELVVSYDPVIAIDLGPIKWTGVFKPTPECDFHFASSEPPTHDSWTPKNTDTEFSTYVVKQTLATISRRARKFLDTGKPEQKPAGYSVRNIATALRNFVPLGSYTPPTETEHSPARKSGGRRARRSTKPSVTVLAHSIEANGRSYSVKFKIESDTAEAVTLTPRPAALTADGPMPLNPEEYSLAWNGEKAIGESSADYESGSIGGLRITTASAIAMELAFETEVAL